MRWGAIVMLAACGPVVLGPQGGTGSTSVDGSSDPSSDPSTTVASMTVASTTSAGTSTTGPIDPTTGSVDTSTSEVDSVGFIQDPDDGHGGFECSTWEQDCPRGEKCMPWAHGGGGTWNATRCTPLAEDPNQPGEACTVVESGVSGIDDCALGAMCWDVDPETLMGECISLCQGSEANPTCPDPCTNCVLASEAALTPCLPGCDPIAQDCSEGQACYPIADSFVCAPDASDEAGALGDECEFINSCDPGLFCADPERVPQCEGSGCCAPFCDVDAPDECDALLPGTSCVAWYDERPPLRACNPGTVGGCMLPA